MQQIPIKAANPSHNRTTPWDPVKPDQKVYCEDGKKHFLAKPEQKRLKCFWSSFLYVSIEECLHPECVMARKSATGCLLDQLKTRTRRSWMGLRSEKKKISFFVCFYSRPKPKLSGKIKVEVPCIWERRGGRDRLCTILPSPPQLLTCQPRLEPNHMWRAAFPLDHVNPDWTQTAATVSSLGCQTVWAAGSVTAGLQSSG